MDKKNMHFSQKKLSNKINGLFVTY